ncbi:hypothetical protein NC653_003332 [Populus alba x Populus x berolinensis]|uniref:Uncharacterized protein n=1 Tax=Populus alba x Populus x berolinensis TaxID=444605 RepID=A0AAD6RR88_9ROSI|nr:hypothetical protein NC653_003332 [Populus alba x Populus x berolinensis]
MIWASVGGVGGIKRAESELFGLFFDVLEMVVVVSSGFGEGSGAFEEEEVVGFLVFEAVVVVGVVEEEEEVVVLVLVGEEASDGQSWFIQERSSKSHSMELGCHDWLTVNFSTGNWLLSPL